MGKDKEEKKKKKREEAEAADAVKEEKVKKEKKVKKEAACAHRSFTRSVLSCGACTEWWSTHRLRGAPCRSQGGGSCG